MSCSEDVSRGVPQGSVLRPLLFIIFINDLDNGVKSKLSKFADDTKLGGKVDIREGGDQIQESINTCVDLAKYWQMEFNLSKCKVLEMGRNNENRDYRMQGVVLERVTQEKDLGVVIDMGDCSTDVTSYLGPGARLDGLEITFQVTEMSALTGSYNTMVGNNEGSMAIGGKLSNMLGRAERLVAQFSYGTKETSYGLSFFKPQTGCFERNITFGLFDVKGQFPWSSVREVDRGVSFDFNFPVWRTRHTVRWEAVWRELSCLSRTASFPVREESGHSLKSSLAHTMVVDCRDSTILPSKGVYLKVNQELAGYTGGDIRFLKEEMELQLNRSLPWGCVSVFCSILFFLGGPTTIRGFNMYSIGPYAESDFLGGDAYWAAGLHLYTPLPFGPGRPGFGDIFRTHLFINAGNLCSLDYGEGLRGHVSRLGSCLRWAYGAGVVLRLGNIARLELNYCFPTGVQLGDR
uniref:SAMM50 sorting and assembly machinery component n=1 Tax=Eptatretus burgeri TaxID=7764 RepID=A0A8C4NGT6_EPTBU